MYLVNIFFDNHNNFQWASIAALIALIGSCASVWIAWLNNKNTIGKQEQMSQANLDLQEKMNKSNFKGNVVSKARIEWIQEVRKQSVDFMSACYNLFDFITLTIDNIIGDINTEKEFVRLKNEIEKNGTLLILYFGPDSNKNNELIVSVVANILERTKNKNGWYDVRELPALAYQVDVLRDFLRIYFKVEWKRANGEIKDFQVQEYLEKDDIYIRIMKIFSGSLENHGEWLESFYNDLEERYTAKVP
ncbi:hypothetical protein ACQCWD_20760 [Bacillus thuringiensis]|uniref:Uncharacterized protein n=1 Tax=Bacillus cereus TaxID=1396 RepID=A0AAN5XKX2_BACCE|nr:hypothetical protein [Bacillus cereus]KAB2447030.1 hypothetical protein F8165_26045 [Bacillus cereus]KAB2486406.1 hypothetical protein F8157_12995 [Bacillus cereus]